MHTNERFGSAVHKNKNKNKNICLIALLVYQFLVMWNLMLHTPYPISFQLFWTLSMVGKGKGSMRREDLPLHCHEFFSWTREELYNPTIIWISKKNWIVYNLLIFLYTWVFHIKFFCALCLFNFFIINMSVRSSLYISINLLTSKINNYISFQCSEILYLTYIGWVMDKEVKNLNLKTMDCKFDYIFF